MNLKTNRVQRTKDQPATQEMVAPASQDSSSANYAFPVSPSCLKKQKHSKVIS